MIPTFLFFFKTASSSFDDAVLSYPIKTERKYTAEGCLSPCPASVLSPRDCPLKQLTFTQTNFHSFFQRTKTIGSRNGNTTLGMFTRPWFFKMMSISQILEIPWPAPSPGAAPHHPKGQIGLWSTNRPSPEMSLSL